LYTTFAHAPHCRPSVKDAIAAGAGAGAGVALLVPVGATTVSSLRGALLAGLGTGASGCVCCDGGWTRKLWWTVSQGVVNRKRKQQNHSKYVAEANQQKLRSFETSALTAAGAAND
jgi:hypothetical protein